MKKILLIASIVVMIVSVIVIKRIRKSSAKVGYTIGILQTASHPALDAAREGFIEKLKERVGDTVEYIVQNAQGSIAQAHTIAQQFHANKNINGFFAIATPAAQALAAIEKERPIFIAAVTDPHALGLIQPTTNVTGVKDMIDIKGIIEMLIQLVPQAKNVGILYTSGETNSQILVEKMRTELLSHGVTPLDFAISNESDVPAIVELACRKVDCIIAPTDNTVASTIAVIASITHKHKKPLIVSDNMLVAFGALAARGVDYTTSGKHAAGIAYEVLVNGKKPYEISVQQASTEKTYINQAVLTDLGLTIPQSLRDQTIIITERK